MPLRHAQLRSTHRMPVYMDKTNGVDVDVDIAKLCSPLSLAASVARRSSTARRLCSVGVSPPCVLLVCCSACRRWRSCLVQEMLLKQIIA